jgi:hypothetical protein
MGKNGIGTGIDRKRKKQQNKPRGLGKKETMRYCFDHAGRGDQAGPLADEVASHQFPVFLRWGDSPTSPSL